MMCLNGVTLAPASVSGLVFPGPRPGIAQAKVEGSQLVLENDLLSVRWDLANGLRLIEATDKSTHETWSTGQSECLQIVYYESPEPEPYTLAGSQMEVLGDPILTDVSVSHVSGRQADRYPGKQFEVHLTARDRSLSVRWRASLRDEANYVRQSGQLQAGSEGGELHQVILLDLPATEAAVHGSVDGSPVVAGRWFMGLEHPMSKSQVEADTTAGSAQRVRCSYQFAPPLAPGESQQYSTVLGLVPKNQLRRGFLYYLERERAYPYRTHLQHTIGEDIGAIYSDLSRQGPDVVQKFSLGQEKWWATIMEDFGRELVVKRNVVIDSFAHDYLWDNPETPWHFVPDRYPDGFTNVRLVAEKYGATLGIWFTPDGVTGSRGRVIAGIEQKFEGFRVGNSYKPLTLVLNVSGPRYFGRFRAAVVNMLRRHGVGYFKFDGIADGYGYPQGGGPSGAGQWFSDFEALLQVYTELRALKPDVFINASTGAWPSPFLLRWADCIWHQGSDVGTYGPEFKDWSKGTPRQRWLTYRDSATYHNGLVRGPLFPLTSYMIHGLAFNLASLGPDSYGVYERVRGLETKDIIDEIQSYFGSGLSLQEMYTHPSVMKPQTWDALAEAANWARANAHVLVDTHWVGGDPAKDEIYGWAAWTPRKGTLTLRNPDDQVRTISLDIAQVFELPEGAPSEYRLSSPWQDQAQSPAIEVVAGQTHDFKLQPFEVLVFDATPVD